MHSARRSGTGALKVAKSRLAWPWEGSWLGSIMVYTGYLAIGAGALRSCVIPNKRTNIAAEASYRSEYVREPLSEADHVHMIQSPS